jgi:hypothetical protein
MQFKVKSSRDVDVIVEGLAVLRAGEERTFSQYDADQFEVVRGLKLTPAALPDGVTLTVLTSDKEV